MKKGHASFSHVVENLIKTFVYSVEICPQHPGYKYKYFSTFKELDKYFKQEFGPNWRQEEWAKFWLKDHNRIETQDYDREEIHKRGKRFRQRTPGSRRYFQEKLGPRQLSKKVPPETLAAFIKELQEQGITSKRKQAEAIREKHGISIGYDTVYRLKKKYNI